MIGIEKDRPWFSPGELVRHVRYGYRGVIVAADTQCEAPDNWYQRNRTQPDRRQPWYHVLVHGGGNVTYAAQSSLTIDPHPQPVAHPLVEIFFDGFNGEHYERNQEPWPDGV